MPAFATNYDGSLDTSLSPLLVPPFAGIPGLFRYAVDLGGGGNYADADSAAAVAVQVDGKFVVAGFSWNNYLGTDQNACVIQRFNLDGSIDSGFGSAGRVVQNFNPSGGQNDCFLSSVALQGDGRIVVAGNLADSSHGERALIERFNADGSPDVSFAGAGYYVVPNHNTAFAAVKVDLSGPIYVAGRGSGFYPPYTDNDFYFAVFSASGTLTQELTTFFDLGADKDDRANAMVFESNSGLPRIYLVGNANSAPYGDQAHHQCAIAAYVYSLNDGGFVSDTSFSGDGATNFDILGQHNEGDTYCRAAVARTGGGLVVGGETYFVSTFSLPAGLASWFALAEIDGAGNVTAHGSELVFQTGAYPGIYNGIFGMAREAGGKILVTGYAGTDDANRQPSDAGVIRLNTDFSRDASFGTVTTDHGVTILSLDGQGGLFTQQREWTTALALDNQGRIVLVGERSYLINNVPGNYDWLISRLNTSDVIFRDGLDGVVPD